MKWTNEEQTMATHNGSSGRPEDLIRLGYATQEDYDNIEPYKTTAELIADRERELTVYLQQYPEQIAREKGYPSAMYLRSLQDSNHERTASEGKQMAWLIDELMAYRDTKAAEVQATGTLPDLETVKNEHPKWGDYPGV